MRIGIVGLGFVGGTLRRWFETWHDELYVYDKFKKIGSMEEVNKAEIIFVAVPTPFTDHYDDSAVRETLANISDGKIVVIKSTILPGSTARFQQQYPNKTILFNPEFLTEAHAYHDFTRPTRQIVGYADRKGMNAAPLVFNLLPAAPDPANEAMSATAAELVKYASNTFLATRVIFANQIYDICQALGADYDTVRGSLEADPRIGSSHFDVLHGGYRGYGGHCLPKDTRALIQLGKFLGASTEFLDGLESVNAKLQLLK